MNNFGLSNNQIIDMAPAAGATAPITGVSDAYSFVPTFEAVDLLRDCGWLPQSAKQGDTRVATRDGFQRHTIRFAMGDLDIGSERVDLLMVNSHDRGCAFQLIASIWRKICGNGLMTSSKLFSFSHKHIGFDRQAFVDSAVAIANSAGQLACHVDEMKDIELSPAERGVFADIAHSYTWGHLDAPPIEAPQLLEERRYDDDGNDLWSTFNVIQENLVKGGLRGVSVNKKGHTRRVTTKPVKSLDRDVKLNKALWSMAEKMAECKDQPLSLAA